MAERILEQDTEIVRLRAELEKDKQATVSIIDAWDAREREIERLRAALEPFAKISLWRDQYPDAKNDELTTRQLKGYIRIADVRAARKAIAYEQNATHSEKSSEK